MRTVRGSFLTVVLLMPSLVLVGCGSDAAEVEPEGEIAPSLPSDDAAPVPDPAATTSILRSDIEQPQIEEEPLVSLEPLQVTIGFPEGGSQLNDEAIGQITDLAKSQQAREDGDIVLRGHSDAGGTDEVNMRTSRARAERVRQQLLVEDIAADRIRIIAFGEQNPVQPNALPDGSPNEAGRAANRRVEVTINVDDAATERAPTETEEE